MCQLTMVTSGMDADELILEVGRNIVLDERYQAEDWVGIALVGDFSGGREAMHGVVYRSDGTWQGQLPADPDDVVLDTLLALREVMAAQSGTSWHQCLIQIHSESENKKVNVKFEYDNPTRWSMRPGDVGALIEELRP